MKLAHPPMILHFVHKRGNKIRSIFWIPYVPSLTRVVTQGSSPSCAIIQNDGCVRPSPLLLQTVWKDAVLKSPATFVFYERLRENLLKSVVDIQNNVRTQKKKVESHHAPAPFQYNVWKNISFLKQTPFKSLCIWPLYLSV